MRRGSLPRKVVLPEGELHRFQLPESTEDEASPERRRPTRIAVWVVAWVGFSWVCFQWSEGRLGPRSWVAPTLEWLRELRDEPRASAQTRPSAPLFDVSAGPAPTQRHAESAAVVRGPSIAAAPLPALTVHGGSFEPSPEARADVPLAPAAASPGVAVEQGGDDSMTVHAGPSCERAKRRYKESFLDEGEDPATVAVLADPKRYRECRAELMSLRVCALVHRGEAIGVTVQSEPPNRVVSTCAAIAAKTAKFPYKKRPQLVRTEVYFQ